MNHVHGVKMSDFGPNRNRLSNYWMDLHDIWYNHSDHSLKINFNKMFIMKYL